jgi:hypothetical protein
MSLASPVGALTRTKILACVSAANTAAATSGWIDARGYEGAVAVEISVGIITGTLDLTFNTNTAGSDSGATAVVPVGGALAQVTTSNDDAIYTAVFEATQLRGYLKVIGTVGTGPSLISYTLIGRKKYAG